MKKLKLLLFILIVLLSVNSYAIVSLGGVKVEESNPLKSGQIIFDADVRIQNNIDAFDSSSIKSDIFRIPLQLRLGLTKNREIGLKLILDSQSKTENTTEITGISLFTKWKIYKELSFKLNTNFATNNKTYYGNDKISLKAEFLLNVFLAGSMGCVNLGYEQTDGTSASGEVYKDRFYYGLSYNYPATKKISFIGELVGKTKLYEDGKDLMQLLFGVKYMLDLDLDLVSSIAAGLSDGSPKTEFSLGFRKQFGIVNTTASIIRHRWKEFEKDDLKQKKNEINNKNKICPTCGYEAQGNEKFCPYDGTILVEPVPVKPEKIFCSVCGNEVPEEANFCPFCGAKIKKDMSASHIVNSKPAKKQPVKSSKIKVNPEVINKILSKAKKAFAAGNFSFAAKQYRKAASLKQDDVKIFYNLGVSLFYSNLYVESKNAFEKAVSINDRDIDSYLYLAAICGQLGLRQEAVLNYKKVLRIDPSNSLAKKNLERLGVY